MGRSTTLERDDVVVVVFHGPPANAPLEEFMNALCEKRREQQQQQQQVEVCIGIDNRFPFDTQKTLFVRSFVVCL